MKKRKKIWALALCVALALLAAAGAAFAQGAADGGENRGFLEKYVEKLIGGGTDSPN